MTNPTADDVAALPSPTGELDAARRMMNDWRIEQGAEPASDGADYTSLERRIAAALTRQSQEIAALRAALIEGATWFEEYARLHAAKMTPEGNDKAAANAQRAAKLRTAAQQPERE